MIPTGATGESENDGRLCVVPPFAVPSRTKGRVVLTRKFIDGVEEYARRWPGPVEVLLGMGRAKVERHNLDSVAVSPTELGFSLAEQRGDREELVHYVRGAAALLGHLSADQLPLAGISRAVGIPMIWLTEFSRKTRDGILASQEPPRRALVRGMLGNARLELRYRTAVREASGVQCNGTPTFRVYSRLNPRALLFFDSRVGDDQFDKTDAFEMRIGELIDGGPLRLVFSGRLARDKGVDDLPLVASELNKHGVDFRLDVFGGGDREPFLRREIEGTSLARRVHLHGVVDFQSQLLPWIRRNADLFVCCHRQGDPSCTYLETMSCGTPIAGYANEAFSGLVETAGSGWTSPLNDPRTLAARIAHLARNRSELAGAARRARAFARAHSFERTMDRRVEHLLSCASSFSSNAAFSRPG